MDKKTWLLPDYIQDQLPEEAWTVEALRRTLVDWFGRHGYRLVGTPLVEHLETLLTGTGEDLDGRTFKFTDSLSGQTLGIRADITPQVARIDACLRDRAGANRLCYCGPVLHATPSQPWSDREPLQVGVELFGCPGPSADWECVDLACSSLRQAGFRDLHVDLGHAGIFAHFMRRADARQRRLARRALVRRDLAPLRGAGLPAGTLGALRKLVEISLEDDPARLLAGAFGKERPVVEIARRLGDLAEALACDGRVEVGIDFCSLAGYNYHTGMVFDVYSGRDRLVRGGRYDGVHKLYDDDRPAVGFSMDLKRMAKASAAARRPRRAKAGAAVVAVPVPERHGAAWSEAVSRLRRAKSQIRFVHGDKVRPPEECTAALVRRGGAWSVVKLERARGE